MHQADLLTIEETAALLRQSPETIRRKARDGTLPVLRLGNGPRAPLRFSEQAIELWLLRGTEDLKEARR